MKIEKVNDHQIRCTLTKEDLASRELKISELAYGSQKAKTLFRDMVEMANYEYGFEADNIPLMIEAIPVNSECIVLIITKVEDPDELDTRFSKFAPDVSDDDDDDDYEEANPANDSSEITDLFKRFKDTLRSYADKDGSGKDEKGTSFDGMAFCFSSMNELSKVAKNATRYFHGSSSLYRNKADGEYILVLLRGRMDVTEFVQTCNLFAEYGAPAKGKKISTSYLDEHCEIICRKGAVEVMAGI